MNIIIKPVGKERKLLGNIPQGKAIGLANYFLFLFIQTMTQKEEYPEDMWIALAENWDLNMWRIDVVHAESADEIDDDTPVDTELHASLYPVVNNSIDVSNPIYLEVPWNCRV